MVESDLGSTADPWDVMLLTHRNSNYNYLILLPSVLTFSYKIVNSLVLMSTERFLAESES
jgi:hypothetical protein